MRIVYLHQYFRTPEMSGGTRSYEMARRFVAAGHEVHMITTDESGEGGRGWRRHEVDGIQVHTLPVRYDNTMSFARRLWSFVHFAAVSGRRASTVRPDVVLATSTPLTIAVPAALVKWRRRVPVVFEVRDLWPEMPIAVGALRNPVLRGLARGLERFAYAISARVVALSPGMAEGVQRSGVAPQRIAVVPNASDRDLFDVDPSVGAAFRASVPWLGDAPLVVYCGTLGHVNQVEWLAELAGRVRHRTSAQFLVMGRGVGLETVRSTAERLGVLDATFHLLPPVPKSDVPAVLSAATVACSLFAPIPEMEVNSANKFFDALAAGRPVFINYGGWQAALLDRSGAGVAVDSSDLDAAADALVDLLHDPGRLAAAGRAAGSLARDEFDRDELAARLLDVVVAAVDGRRSRDD